MVTLGTMSDYEAPPAFPLSADVAACLPEGVRDRVSAAQVLPVGDYTLVHPPTMGRLARWWANPTRVLFSTIGPVSAAVFFFSVFGPSQGTEFFTLFCLSALAGTIPFWLGPLLARIPSRRRRRTARMTTPSKYVLGFLANRSEKITRASMVGADLDILWHRIVKTLSERDTILLSPLATRSPVEVEALDALGVLLEHDVEEYVTLCEETAQEQTEDLDRESIRDLRRSARERQAEAARKDAATRVLAETQATLEVERLRD